MIFRKGDIVSVRGTVEYTERKDSTAVFVKVPGAINPLMLDKDEREAACIKLEIPQFAQGELVSFKWIDDTRKEFEGVGRILAISNGHAWIDRGGGDYATRLLTTLQRLDDPENSDEA